MVNKTSKWTLIRIGEDKALRWKNLMASAMPFSTRHRRRGAARSSEIQVIVSGKQLHDHFSDNNLPGPFVMAEKDQDSWTRGLGIFVWDRDMDRFEALSSSGNFLLVAGG
jgi:hypothetical protein